VIGLVGEGLGEQTGIKDAPFQTVERVIIQAVGVEPKDQAHLTAWACGVLAAMREGDLPYPARIDRGPQPLDALWTAISGERRSAAAQSRAARCGQAWRLGIRVGSIDSGTKIMRAIEQQAERSGESEQEIAGRVVRAQFEIDPHLPERSLLPILLDAVSPGRGRSESKRITRIDTDAKIRRLGKGADPDVAALTIADSEQRSTLVSRIVEIVDKQDFDAFVKSVRACYRKTDRA
jgi:hypothetical protein